MPPKALSLLTRFERYVIPEPMSGCWLWVGGVEKFGYGVLNVGQRPQHAHRIAWLLFRGRVPRRLYVCHRCDIPCCVNPEHLFLGTHDENMADMVSKGRVAHSSGTRNAHAKLTDDLARAIYRDTRKHHEIAAAFGISMGVVGNIRTDRAWRHATRGLRQDG